MEQSERKLARIGTRSARRARIEEVWPELFRGLADDLAPARNYATILPSIGVGDAILRTAWREARWIRDRYTVLDLVDDLGLTGPLEGPAHDPSGPR